MSEDMEDHVTSVLWAGLVLKSIVFLMAGTTTEPYSSAVAPEFTFITCPAVPIAAGKALGLNCNWPDPSVVIGLFAVPSAAGSFRGENANVPDALVVRGAFAPPSVEGKVKVVPPFFCI